MQICQGHFVKQVIDTEVLLISVDGNPAILLHGPETWESSLAPLFSHNPHPIQLEILLPLRLNMPQIQPLPQLTPAFKLPSSHLNWATASNWSPCFHSLHSTVFSQHCSWHDPIKTLTNYVMSVFKPSNDSPSQ